MVRSCYKRNVATALCLIVLAAGQSRAAWTNRWYGGWTNAGGWMAYRYAKDLKLMLAERETVCGHTFSNSTPSLWPTRRWMGKIDYTVQKMAPYFVDQTRLPSPTLTNGVPVWTFSNACVEAGLTNGAFSWPFWPNTTNAPLWPRKADLVERRAVAALYYLTVKTNEIYNPTTWPAESNHLGGAYSAWSNSLAGAQAYVENTQGSFGWGSGYGPFYAYSHIWCRALPSWSKLATNWQYRVSWNRKFTHMDSASFTSNYAADVTAYVALTTNRSALGNGAPNGHTLGQVCQTGSTNSMWDTPLSLVYGYWYEHYGTYDSNSDPNLPGTMGTNVWATINKPKAEHTVRAYLGNTNKNAAIAWPDAPPQYTNAPIEQTRTRGYTYSFTGECGPGYAGILPTHEIDKNGIFIANWSVTNGLEFMLD